MEGEEREKNERSEGDKRDRAMLRNNVDQQPIKKRDRGRGIVELGREGKGRAERTGRYIKN